LCITCLVQSSKQTKGNQRTFLPTMDVDDIFDAMYGAGAVNADEDAGEDEVVARMHAANMSVTMMMMGRYFERLRDI